MSKGGFQVSARTQAILGAVVAVVTLGSKGALQLPVGIPAWIGPVIQSWDTFILQIYTVGAPFLLLFSDNDPGPLAPPDPPAVAAAKQAQK